LRGSCYEFERKNPAKRSRKDKPSTPLHSFKEITMKKLPLERIKELANRTNVCPTAVANFLTSLSGNKVDDFLNLRLDLDIYKWNFETVMAIRDGIVHAYKEDK